MAIRTNSPIMQETHGVCPEELRNPMGLGVDWARVSVFGHQGEQVLVQW